MFSNAGNIIAAGMGLGLTHVLTGPIPVNMYSNYPTSFCSSFCFGIKIGICQTVGLIVVIASCSYLIFTSQHDYTSSSSSSYYTHISLSIRISKSIEHASQIGLGLYMICIGLSRFCLAFKRMHQLEDDHEEQIMFNADNEKHDTFSSFRNLGLGSSKTNLPRINSMLSINISQHCPDDTDPKDMRESIFSSSSDEEEDEPLAEFEDSKIPQDELKDRRSLFHQIPNLKVSIRSSQSDDEKGSKRSFSFTRRSSNDTNDSGHDSFPKNKERSMSFVSTGSSRKSSEFDDFDTYEESQTLIVVKSIMQGIALGLLPLLQIRKFSIAIYFLMFFMISSTIGIGIFAAGYNLFTKYVQLSRTKIRLRIDMTAGLFSILFGCVWLVSFKTGMFRHMMQYSIPKGYDGGF